MLATLGRLMVVGKEGTVQRLAFVGADAQDWGTKSVAATIGTIIVLLADSMWYDISCERILNRKS